MLTSHPLLWGLPFLGMLLSIALLPAVLPALWHRRMDAVAAGWCLVLLVPQAMVFGAQPAMARAWHALLIEYLPLLSLLLALYVIGGGLLVEGGRFGTPGGNTVFLALGMLAAAVLGTTGASMMLIVPLLRANAHRARRAHLAIFFIILVANVGGGILPLGPPLYIGFLRGVPFFWPLLALAGPLLVVAAPLLGAFYLVDRHHARREPSGPAPLRLQIGGVRNLPLAVLVVASVLGQLVWHPGSVVLLGQAVEITRLLGIAVCLAAAALSLWMTPTAIRAANDFQWGPMHEVAVLFAGLFITIAPVLDMLAAGPHGPLSAVFAVTRDHAGSPIPLVYFWLSGLLSGFLDNAPTYLVFFQQAGGNAAELTGVHARTLMAISAGSVLFGGLSYIGNAPNLMVRAIAQHQGVRMPGFVVYAVVAACLLQPCFIAISLIFLW